VKPYYSDEWVTLYHGDCLRVLGGLSASLAAVVADPPYASGARTEAAKPASGAMLRGGRFASRPIDLDQMTTPGFVWLMREVALACRPLVVEGGAFLSFIDWRQWPNLVGALESANYRVNQMVVWDKESFGMGWTFRNQHELILAASKGKPTMVDRGVGSVLRVKREPPVEHPSPKPPGLIAQLLKAVTNPGDVVLDPFMGAGSTLRAAKDIGRKAIGIEIEERYCEIAARRLSQEVLALSTPTETSDG